MEIRELVFMRPVQTPKVYQDLVCSEEIESGLEQDQMLTKEQKYKSMG